MQTFVLSLLQSITEFLPVSSSGHLIAFPALFGWKEQGFAVDIGLHLGTLLAVCIYFMPYLWKMFIGLWREGVARHQAILLIIATFPIVIFGFLFRSYVDFVRYPYIVCFTLISFGILLWWSDKVSSCDKKIQDLRYLDAFYIGLAQCLSLIPGTSRSGVTMTAARFCHLNRSDAATFSMLLSIPVIAGAGVWLLLDLSINNQLALLDKQFFESILYSFLGGLLVVRFLMQFVKRYSFFAFMIYRVALGLFLLLFFVF